MAAAETTEDASHRGPLTVCVILATLMQALDTTIANVALPYMQGSVSASQDQIDWVLTSYIVAAAIMTPPTGFLAGRFGIKRLFMVSIAGFTLASMLCGMAQSLPQIVLFRVLQGAFGAALVPLSQSVLFSVYPKERQGFAMALFGIGVMIGPVLGPVLGGWLTYNYSWRFVFYINLPIGILDLLGIMFFLTESPRREGAKLDWFGFGTLSLTLGALQIMLDRGEQQGLVQLRRDRHRGDRGRFRILSVHRPHVHCGKAVRASGSVPRSQFCGRHAVHRRRRPDLLRLDGAAAALSSGADGLSGDHLRFGHGPARRRHHGVHADRRAAGRAGRHPPPARRGAWPHGSWSFYQMTGWTPDISQERIIAVTMVQGAGLGFLFVPLSAATLSTLPLHDRTEGAGLYSLFRNIGSSIGISVMNAMLITNTQANHASIAGACDGGEPRLRESARWRISGIR